MAHSLVAGSHRADSRRVAGSRRVVDSSHKLEVDSHNLAADEDSGRDSDVVEASRRPARSNLYSSPELNNGRESINP